MTGGSKPKTLKDLKNEISSREEVMSRVALAQIASDYEAVMLSASLLEYMLMQAITTKFIPLGVAVVFISGGFLSGAAIFKESGDRVQIEPLAPTSVSCTTMGPGLYARSQPKSNFHMLSEF
jgi:hypothetical protein